MILALSTTSRIDGIFQLINVLIIFVLVLAVTYFATRWIAKMQKGNNLNVNIEIIETFRITNNKYIQIIRTGKVYLVIAVCKDTVTMLTQLDESQLDEVKAIRQESDSFAEMLDKVKKIKQKK